MNQDQVLSRLYPLYHDDFLEFSRTNLGINEKILGIANCARVDRMGYFMVTPRRCVFVYVKDPSFFFGRKKIRYARTPGDMVVGPINFYWFPDPVSPLKKNEKEYRNVVEASNTTLQRVETAPYAIKHKQQIIKLLQITPHGDAYWGEFSHMAFEADAGEEIYRILVKIIRGEVTNTESPKTHNITSELERLSTLYQNGLLSHEQFEAAKRKLLKL